MKQAGQAERDLARKILAIEASEYAAPKVKAQAGLRACEKLRLNLQKLIGVAGFQALLSRALALARAEVSWLKGVQVEATGELHGFDETAPSQDLEVAAKGGEVLLAQLLGLLVTFIGEALTLRLVRDIWPLSAMDEASLSAEEIP